MNTTDKLMLAAVIAASLTIANPVTAGEPLLSPRARGNQAQMVKGTNADQNLATANRNGIASPRALGSQILVVKGTNNDRNLVAESRNLIGSPRLQGTLGSRTPEFQIAPVK